MNGALLSDLETKGYVLMRGFLPPDDLEVLQADAAQAPSDGNRNYNLMTASAEAAALVSTRVDALLAEVNEQTALNVHAPAGANYFATGVAAGINFPWHQDHESYFIYQNHYDYLNFYMPIVKPATEKSNVSLMPFDVLEREAPRVYERFLRSGARHFQEVAGRSLAVSDETGEVWLMPKHITELGVTPHLAAGDLLLFRGDMLHRTQDADTVRVAMSLRRACDTSPIRRDRLVSGGVRKALMMSNYPLIYQAMFEVFDAAGRDEMTFAEMRAASEGMVVPEPARRRAFLKQLLAEKRRAHVLTSFVADAPRFVALNAFTRAQTRYKVMRARRAA